MRTRVDLRVKEGSEGSASDEAEDYKGTSMVGVIWQCAVKLSDSAHAQNLHDDGAF